MTPSKVFDILIIGSGPAGLSAALAASRQFRTTLVLSSPAHPYRNTAAHHMHNVLGFDHVPPALFRGHAVMQLKDRYSPFIDFVEDANISSVKKAEVDNKGGMDLFVAADAQGRSWKGRKVILATGSRDIFPDIQGYAGVWGNGIFHCPFCHGYEQRGGASAGFLYLNRDPKMIGPFTGVMAFVLRFPKASESKSGNKYNFTIFTHGAPDTFLDELKANPNIQLMLKKGVRIDNRQIVSFEMIDSPQGKTTPDDEGQDLEITFDDGNTVSTKFLLHHPKTELSPLGATVASEFGIELNAMGDIPPASPMQDTQVPGLYIAGDMSTAMKAVPTALYQGTLAGVTASRALAMEDLHDNDEVDADDAKDSATETLLGLGSSANIARVKEL